MNPRVLNSSILLIGLVSALKVQAQDQGPFSYGSSSDSIHITADTMPRFPDGEQALLTYLMTDPACPTEVLQTRTELSFVVRRDGHLSDIQVIDPWCVQDGRDLQRALQSMPTWIPGFLNGRAVDVRCRLPLQRCAR